MASDVLAGKQQRIRTDVGCYNLRVGSTEGDGRGNAAGSRADIGDQRLIDIGDRLKRTLTTDFRLRSRDQGRRATLDLKSEPLGFADNILIVLVILAFLRVGIGMDILPLLIVAFAAF